jgi:hypothetical protein
LGGQIIITPETIIGGAAEEKKSYGPNVGRQFDGVNLVIEFLCAKLGDDRMGSLEASSMRN